MQLYKFRPLGNEDHLKRIKDIIEKGFYCCDFLSFNDVNEGVFSVNSENIDISVEEKKKYKICSLSGKNALISLLMWGHYANAGMGVVIEVDVQDFSKIKQVRYSNSTDELNSIEEILTRKSKEWEYENEFRYLSNDNISCSVKLGTITMIYFGTPYKQLLNYCDIKEKHEGLKRYLELKEKLENFCYENNDVPCKDFKFN
ncbi:MAG: DUF2971 domain-containing protein [Campylobacterota bacterium]|nr:DUF2971 domain-containing protein [Campylobacterota bacterium]